MFKFCKQVVNLQLHVYVQPLMALFVIKYPEKYINDKIYMQGIYVSINK